jgi:hypothetical protein
MDLHAAFESSLNQHVSSGGEGTSIPVAAVGGDAADDLYASLMSKEHNVLGLIRRVDETRRSDALQKAEHIAPLAHAFVSGLAGFAARFVHYSSKGAINEVVGLCTSPDGMIYSGVIIVVIALLLMSI